MSVWLQVRGWIDAKVNDSAETTTTTYSSEKIQNLINGILPADPGADKFLKWNNTTNEVEWADTDSVLNTNNFAIAMAVAL